MLYGGDGNDLLSGGNGDDVMTGGAGADVFVFNWRNSPNNREDWADDEITDFVIGDPLAATEARQDGLLGIVFKLFG